jgi:RNA polymerase subunit RPABC4/transcription elongation factor Spt4
MKNKTCPFCGSEDVAQTKTAGILFLVLSLLFMFPVPLFMKRYYCFDCKQLFKYQAKTAQLKN